VRGESSHGDEVGMKEVVVAMIVFDGSQ